MTRIIAGAVLTAVVAGCGITVPPRAHRELEPPLEVVGQKTVWEDADRGWVRLVAAEAGGDHDHPVRVDTQWLRQGFYDIKLEIQEVNEGHRWRRLFRVEQLDAIVPSLVNGLAQAGPDQAVAFATAGRPEGFSFFPSMRLTTGRVFVTDGELNILFGAMAEPVPRGKVRSYIAKATPGTRDRGLSRSNEVWTRGWEARTKRDDWVVLPVKTSDAPLPEIPVSGPAPRIEYRDGDAAQAERARAVRERLELLRDLHAKGLITDEEYREKRQQVLDDL
jgi:hypothetical protein